MDIQHKLKLTIAPLIMASMAFPAVAVINDAPYFNLWAEGVESAGETGQGSVAELCGTENCKGAHTATDIAVFRTVMDPDTARGSGAINPFLRFQHNESAAGFETIERAFNTSNTNVGTITEAGGTMYENQAIDSVAGGHMRNTFNHAVKLSDLLVEDGVYKFLLDINEPGGDKSLLRLDELAFFISTVDDLNEFDRGDNSVGSLNFNDGDGMAYKVWDMDFNQEMLPPKTDANKPQNVGGLLLDNINDTGPAGSGDYDLQVELKKDLFDRVIADAQATSSITADNAYVYLYNWAGEAQGSSGPGPHGNPDDGEAQAGFEEWAVVVDTTPDEEPPGMPEPATAFLMLGGIAGMSRLRRRWRAKS